MSECIFIEFPPVLNISGNVQAQSLASMSTHWHTLFVSHFRKPSVELPCFLRLESQICEPDLKFWGCTNRCVHSSSVKCTFLVSDALLISFFHFGFKEIQEIVFLEDNLPRALMICCFEIKTSIDCS